nr:RNA polymerase sigma factor [Paludisphaera mucosa]
MWTTGATAGVDDGALLSRFAAGRGEAAEEAFRILVERHGPMVLDVCRRAVGDRQHAEDAAQAVFLTLARKAASVRVDGTLAPWLHGTARRVAARARSRSAARRSAEARAIAGSASRRPAAAEEAPPAGDWEAVHDEVDRLAEKYRAPVVLCCLQGRTYEEAAARIGCPVGTVRVRLSRARDRLRDRLARRGFGPERLAAVGWLAPHADLLLARAAAPLVEASPAWAAATAGAALALAEGRAGSGLVSATAFELYKGMARTMTMQGFQIAAAWTLAAGMTTVGAIAFSATGLGPGGPPDRPARQDAPPAEVPTKAPEKPADPLTEAPEALERRIDDVRGRILAAARARLDAQRNYYNQGRITIDRFLDASQNLMVAETAVAEDDSARVAAAQGHLDRIVEIMGREEARLKSGRGTAADVTEARASLENATLLYLDAVRTARRLREADDLRRRVEALEKRLDEPLLKPDRPTSGPPSP